VRVEECDLPPEDAAPRPLVDELGPGRRKAGEFRANVVDLEREVVHALPAPGKELADRGLRAPRRHQLDAALTEAEERDVSPLIIEGLAELDLRTEEALVGLDRLLEILDRDPDVVETANGHPGDATGRAVPLGPRLELAQRPDDADGLGGA
jgi:hypothetical protein